MKLSDCRVDVYTSGPNVMPVVRVTHIPTGCVAESQATWSQDRNRGLAIKALKTLIKSKV